MPELDAAKIVTCNFHVDGFQGNYRYNMILGQDIFSELKYTYVYL